MSMKTDHVIQSISCILKESVIKLQLLRLICNNNSSALDLILPSAANEHKNETENIENRTSNEAKQIIKEILQLMMEYSTIVNNPELELNEEISAFLTTIKIQINRKFHTVFTQCMTKINHSKSLNADILQIMADANMNRNQKTKHEKWENIGYSFIEYLHLRCNLFQELAIMQKPETISDTINKYVAEYKSLKLEFDELENNSNTDQECRKEIENDLLFIVNKLTKDKQELIEDYSRIEEQLSNYQSVQKQQQIEEHDKCIKRLNAIIEKTQQKLSETKNTNMDIILEQKKKVKRIENEVEEVDSNYNREMIDIHSQMENYGHLHKNEILRLYELRIKLNAFVVKREEHEKKIEQQRKIEEEFKEKCTNACVTIQAMWKGHCVRKALKQKSKKKKGKDGKSKSKKRKKKT